MKHTFVKCKFEIERQLMFEVRQWPEFKFDVFIEQIIQLPFFKNGNVNTRIFKRAYPYGLSNANISHYIFVYAEILPI